MARRPFSDGSRGDEQLVRKLPALLRQHRPDLMEGEKLYRSPAGFTSWSGHWAKAVAVELALELRPDVLDLAHRHGASNLRVYGSIATGLEHESSDLDLLVDLSPEHSLLGVISLRPGSGRPARLLGGCHRRDIPAPPDPRRNPRPGGGVMSKEQPVI